MGDRMSTTTIRLTAEVKARVASVAAKAGVTPHGFILDAIAQAADDAERRSAFEVAVDQRFAKILATGKTIPWIDMQKYLKARVAGKSATRPVARRFTR